MRSPLLTSLTYLAVVGLSAARDVRVAASDEPALPSAVIDGVGPGWRELGRGDFENVNCDADTWSWTEDGVTHCTGVPTGVARTKFQVTNFELVLQWRHLSSGGNSGVFVWSTAEALTDVPRNTLPKIGIEVQILDHGFTENYVKRTGKGAPFFFSTNGDVFPVGQSTMTPFEPTSPNGQRSFPRKNLSLGSPEWNHYYIRGINGEVRLWVNGQEVSGGTNCEPRSGYLCLESEGAPVEFKNIRIRELP